MIFFYIDDTLFDNTGVEIKAARRYFGQFPELCFSTRVIEGDFLKTPHRLKMKRGVFQRSLEEVMNVVNHPANRRQSERTHPRVPYRIAILEKQFQLDNISNEGIGIAVEGPDVFFIGQRIDTIVFEGEDPESPLSGIVSHISKDKHGFLCGIRFIFNGSRDFNYAKGLNLKFNENQV